MTYRYTILSFLCITWSVFCGWSDPVLIKKDAGIALPSIYADRHSSKAYIFFSQTVTKDNIVESSVCYKEFGPSEANVVEHCVKQPRVVEDVSGVVGNGGSSIYVAYSARRNSNTTECGKKGDGCYDVYFVESKNNGKDWTKAVQIPRHNMSDTTHRSGPKIMLINEKARLMIAFTRYSHDEKKYQIATATRANQSSIFANEIVIDAYWSSPLTNKTLTYTVSETEVTAHIILEPKGYCFQERYSNDYGRTWKVSCLISGHNIMYSMAPSWNHTSICMASLNDDGEFTMSWLKHDNQWDQADFDVTGYEFNPVIASVPNTNNTFLFTGQVKGDKVSTYTFNTDDQSLTDLQQTAPAHPYHEASTALHESATKIRILHYIGADLYMSTHT